MSRRMCGAVAAIFLAVTLSFGQAEITGRIAGVVTDATGALIPGVSVKVEGPTLFVSQSVITAENASYFVDKLPPGTYKVTYTFPGFKTIERSDVVVRANFTATLNITLEVGAVEETVVVTGAAPVVDVRSATMATTFDAALLKEIPHGRDTWSMLAQVPGLAPAKFDVGGTESFQQTGTNMHGAQGQQVYNVNGLNLNWPGGAGTATAFYFDNEAFQEVQVVTDAAQSEIGVGGVQINMITKQGSNEVHGATSLFYTTAGLTSQPNYPIFNGRAVESGTKITMMRDFNSQAGFPIIRDRFWFYSSVRAYHINLAVPAVKRPDGSAIQDTNLQRDVTVRGDIAISSRQKLSLNWLYNDINRYFRPGGGFVDDVATGLQLEHAWVGQAQYSYTPTNNLVLETRFGNMTLHFPQAYQKEVKPGTVAVIDTVLNTTKYARPAGSTLNHTWHTRATQNASYFRGGVLGGSHNLRGGFEYARMSNGNRVDIYRDINVRLANGQPLDAILFNTPRRSLERSNETALFIQNSYVVGRLTINGGVRYDRFLTFLPAQKSPAGSWAHLAPERSFPRSENIVEWNNFSPRIGTAYDVTGQGRAVIRASFSQNVLLQGTSLAANLNPNAAASCTHTYTRLGPDNFPLDLNLNPVSCTGGRFTTVDPNITRPFSRQATIGYEQQLFGNLATSFGYYYRTTRNQTATVNRAATPNDYSPLTVVNPLTNQPMTIYNLAPAKRGLTDQFISNFQDLNDNAYHGFEINATKRLKDNWQMLGGFTAQRKKGNRGGDLNNPNNDIFRKGIVLDDDSTYIFKLAGTYNFPLGITGSGNLQHYTGYSYTPQTLFRAGNDAAGRSVNLTQGSITVPLISRGEQRLPDVNILNIRIGYRRTVSDRFRVDPTVDLYNVFNKNTITGKVNDIGPNFGRASTNISQRFVKFGLRIEF